MTPSFAEHDPVDPPREDAPADHGAPATTNPYTERAPNSMSDATAVDPSNVDPSNVDPSNVDPSNVGSSNVGSSNVGSSNAGSSNAGSSNVGNNDFDSSAGDRSADIALTDADGTPLEANETRRTIKRYSNRKLYDTRQSRYVTLLQIAEMVRAGEDVQIIDNATKEDKTDVTLALIISEELKARPRAIPLATLKALIRHRGGKLLTQLRESPIGRLMPREEGALGEHETVSGPELAEGPGSNSVNAEESHVSKEQPGGLRRTLEQWQHTIDDRIRAVVPHYSTIQELQGEVQQLSKRLEELEKRLAAPHE